MAKELTVEIMREVFAEKGDKPLDPTGCRCPVEVVLAEKGIAADPGACRGYWVDYAKRKRVEHPNDPLIAEFVAVVDRWAYARRDFPMREITGKMAADMLDKAEKIRGRIR